MWFSAYPLYPLYGNWCFSQGMKYYEHVPNSLRNKNLKRLISNLLEKVVFWPPKQCSPSRALGKKAFSSTLNVMISQMVRNECLWFGVHVDIQGSYKILQLEIPNEVVILYQPPCFLEGLFWSNFDKKHPLSFRG
jgi:hypothetical protein